MGDTNYRIILGERGSPSRGCEPIGPGLTLGTPGFYFAYKSYPERRSNFAYYARTGAYLPVPVSSLGSTPKASANFRIVEGRALALSCSIREIEFILTE